MSKSMAKKVKKAAAKVVKKIKKTTRAAGTTRERKPKEDPLKALVGRVVNDGRKVVAVYPKKDLSKAKGREFVELRLVDKVSMVVPMDEIEDYLKQK